LAALARPQKSSPLADDTVVYSTDTVAMYMHIDNNHGINSIQCRLDPHAHQLPAKFPMKKRILDGLNIVMRTNIFTFGSRYAQTGSPKCLA
jgi:hypothetical protein